MDIQDPCIKFLDMLCQSNCQDKFHKQQPYILICLDHNCKNKGDTVCSECMVERHNHNSQSFVSIQKLKQYLIQQRRKNQKNGINSDNALLQQNPGYEQAFEDLLEKFQIFKQNIMKQLEEIETKLKRQVDMYTVHKQFDAEYEDILDDKMQQLKQKLKFFAKQYDLNEEKQIEESINIDSHMKQMLSNQKPKFDIINKKFLQIMQSQINLNKFVKFEDVQRQSHKKERNICRFQNYADGEWGVNQNTYIKMGFQLKNEKDEINLLGIKQNKIQRWKGKDQINFRLVIFQSKRIGDHLIFDEQFTVKQSYETLDESGEFYELVFSKPVKIEANQKYIIAQLHPDTCTTYCGGGKKDPSLIQDFEFFEVKDTRSFEGFDPQPMHDVQEFGLLHYFIYKKI